MRKLLHASFIIMLTAIWFMSFIIVKNSIAADEKSSSNSATSGATIDDKVKSLKEKLATKVAELRESQTRGFYGEISAVSKTSFTLISSTGEVKVRYNDDTLLFKLGDKKSEASASSLKNTVTVSSLGLYDKDNSTQTAKVILIQAYPKHFIGQVTQIDKTNAVITIKIDKDKTLEFDYEKNTLANEYDPGEKKIVKSGLSRIALDDRLEIWANPGEDDNQKLKLVRLLKYPKEIFSATSTTPLPEVKPSPVASVSASPKASPKSTSKSTPKPSQKPSAS